MRIHNPAITGSLTVSGSTTFSAGTVEFTGANQKISGSVTSTEILISFVWIQPLKRITKIINKIWTFSID